jgi:hypothetical protein
MILAAVKQIPSVKKFLLLTVDDETDAGNKYFNASTKNVGIICMT